MFVVESAGLTDVGRKRSGNEDDLLVDDGLSLYIVADGMGGHQAGEVASRLVVETIKNYIQRFRESADAEELEDIDHTLSMEANRLLAAIRLANNGIYKVSTSQAACHGMGATVSAVYFTDKTFIAANVGDSPIYLIHDGQIELVSVLHTVVAEQAALNPDGVNDLGAEFRHMLTRGMGIKESVEADISEIQCFHGDRLVIGSDGLTDKVTPEEILNIAAREKPEKACRLLVELANERGGDDNITVIILSINALDGLKGMFAKLGRTFSNIFKNQP